VPWLNRSHGRGSYRNFWGAGSKSLQESFQSGVLNYRPPSLVVDLKQSTEAKHETRDGIDDVLIDRHCDQHKNLKMAWLYLIYFCRPVTFTDDKFGKVIRSLSFACLEGKVNFAWLVEIIPHLIFL
jgi:hypothetical protein